MRHAAAWLTLFAVVLAVAVGMKPSTAQNGVATPRPAAQRPLLLAHYMPWFEAKPQSGAWGWHWTMNHFQPDTLDKEQRRPIAAHDYPLTGPYDSADPDTLEYHALLMKLTGIDGVIIDWYGTATYNDYPVIHRNTGHLIETLKRFGLKFAICYEDQSVRQRVDAGVIKPEEALEQGRRDLRWVREHWFKEPLYVQSEGKPLLLAFGTPYFKTEQWNDLFTTVGIAPAFYTEDNPIPPAEGVFGWPPMWMSQGKQLSKAQVEEYLKTLYAKPTRKIGVAFPGFHDIYAEAQVHPSFGFLPADEGAVLARTLQAARDSRSRFIQIATWNDFGEGTSIEPTREYGYRYLEIIRKSQQEAGHAGPSDLASLRLPLQVWRLRKQATTPDQRKAIDAAVEELQTGQYAKANREIDSLTRALKDAPVPFL